MTLSPVEIRDLSEQQTAVVHHRVTMAEVGQIPGWLGETHEAVQRAGLQPAGMPFVRTFAMDNQAHRMDIEVGWPIAAQFPADGEVHASSLPGGRAAVVSYFGPYEGIGTAYEAVQAWCTGQGEQVAGPPWESYCTDPHEEPDQSKWRTDVYFPLRG